MTSILKVNTIQDATNSTTAISVDTAGRVSTPVRVGFAGISPRPHDTSNSTVTTGQNVYMDTEYFNSGHFVNSTATGQGQFTCPVAGAYLLQAYFLVDNDAPDTQLCRYSWRLNGTEKYIAYDNNRSTGGGTYYEGMMSAGGVLICSENDIITLQVTAGKIHSAAESSMSIYYLG